MNRVAILTHEHASLFELGCATELFAMPRDEHEQWYQGEIVNFVDQQVTATGNITINVKKIDTLDEYDTLVIPSWSTTNPEVALEIKAQVVAFYERGGKLLSFCSGAFFIAECGLFLGKKATTHWRYAEVFKQHYPDVQFIDDVLYVYDDRVGCSAGSAAALDFGLEVIRKDFGHDIANDVARRLVIPPHRNGGQSQFVETPMMENKTLFASTLDWAIENLHTPLNVESLAEKAAMSRRSFDRHFRASIGLSPKEWLNSQRLRLAKKLLESNRDNMEQIAEQSGFNNAMNLRHYFRQQLGISPSQYRSQFGIRDN